MNTKEKTLSERTKEMITIYQQLLGLGIDRQFEDMEIFYTAANEFVKNKTPGKGIIKLQMLQREVHYELILLHPKPSNLLLKYIG